MYKHTSHRPTPNTVLRSASKPASQTTARFMLAAILIIGALAYTQAHAELPTLQHLKALPTTSAAA
ncbi:MAG: hypothetical protein EPN67_01840 [Pusillimonas sp.]|nr:MAG: hypothetical protein EPN67_01840 [Pusillimonas sp.]